MDGINATALIDLSETVLTSALTAIILTKQAAWALSAEAITLTHEKERFSQAVAIKEINAPKKLIQALKLVQLMLKDLIPRV